MARENTKNNFSLVLILIIIFIAGSYFAFSYYKKVKDLVSRGSTQTQKTNVANETPSDIDDACDNTKRLTESLYTQDEVKSAKLVDENNCKLTLDDNTSFAYPTDWFIEYSKTNWKEVALYYPEYDLGNTPPISFIGMNVEWQSSLESSMLAYFDLLDVQREEIPAGLGGIVTPLMFKNDVKSTRLDTFGGTNVLEIIPREDSISYGTIYYVFSIGEDNDIWLIKISNQEFLYENNEVIEKIINSFSR